MDRWMQPFAMIATQLGRFLVWLYYSPIKIIGRRSIPRTGSVLFVANHANSLIDPIMVGMVARRRVRFLGKAPLFKIPFLGMLIKALGMIPLYRAKDDPQKTKESFSSLAEAVDALLAGECVGILPEGKTHDQRALTDVFGGAARMIQQAVEAGVTDLKVIPVGINYDDKRLFRSAVWIEVGEAIDPTQWIAAEGNSAQMRRALTGEIRLRMRDVIIHLDDPALEEFLTDLEFLDPAMLLNHRQKVFSLQQRKSVADALNYFLKEKPESVASVGRALIAHRAHLKEYGLLVDSDIIHVRGMRRICILFWRTLRLGFGWIPVICGFIGTEVFQEFATPVVFMAARNPNGLCP